MQRRIFFKKSLLASSVFLPLSFSNIAESKSALKNDNETLIKPPVLKKGDKVALISPASPANRDDFEKAIKNIESIGLEPVHNMVARLRLDFLAGTPQIRAEEIHNYLLDPDIKALWCVRGGYGTMTLLSHLNFDLIRQYPKALLGYSDITALHMAWLVMSGLVSYHGVVAASSFTKEVTDHLEKVVFQNTKESRLGAADIAAINKHQGPDPYVVYPGQASGKLIGGNLTLLCSLLGTPFFPDLKGAILFIEEVGESPYRVDRMLTQLQLSGHLDGLKGIAMGVFHNCETKKEDPHYPYSLPLKSLLIERLSYLAIPILYGLKFGHVDQNLMIPQGLQGQLNTESFQLQITEKYFA